jgi:hypothetical protein
MPARDRRPGRVRTDGFEPPQREAARLQRAGLTSAQRPQGRVAGRARTGADGAHNPGCFRLHHGHHESGDDRTRTGGLSPDKRALCALSYAPGKEVEGGIGFPQPETETSPSDRLRSQLLPIGTPASRCLDRHLLTGWPWRLVGASCTLGPALCTALVPSLPRPARRRANPQVRGWDSNPRSRAHEARGDSRSPTAQQVWPAGLEPAVSGSRNRRGGHAPPQPDAAPPAGLEPAASGLRARRHLPFDHGGMSKAPAAGVEPASHE